MYTRPGAVSGVVIWTDDFADLPLVIAVINIHLDEPSSVGWGECDEIISGNSSRRNLMGGIPL
uniref:Uncharacterized protein n=1 Tax=Bionectria ochroleuca TaxID=29856 RepID=A0A0B7JXV3_BIOOC